MPLTLLTHVWNEELLMPHWIKHHVGMFDHGIVVDQHCTDRTIEIVRSIAPSWEVRRSRCAEFDARETDREMMEIEEGVAGWKIVLNTTEFLLCHDLQLYVKWMNKYRPDVCGVWAFDLIMIDTEETFGSPLSDEPLWLQRRFGRAGNGERSRMLHQGQHGRYGWGRHDSEIVPKILDDGVFVVWFGWSPYPQVRPRKLAIQTRMSLRDKREGLGTQHIISGDEIDMKWKEAASTAGDLWTAFPAYGDLIAHLCHRASGVSAVECNNG